MTRGSSGPPAAFAAVVIMASAVAPGTSSLAVEVCVLALIGLSLDVVLRGLGAAALCQPGVFAVAAWVTAELLRRNQSPVVALCVAAAAGGAVALVCLLGVGAGRAGLTVAGLGVSLIATGLAPVAPAFLPPVFLGVSLATSRAAVVMALAGLAAGVWLCDRLLRGELHRWVVIARDAPDLLPRAGVSLGAVRGGALAVSGVLAGLAGWAAAVGSLGTPSAGGIDPALVFAWLLIPLAARAVSEKSAAHGLAATLAGATLFAVVARAAEAAGVPVLAPAGALVVALVWRQAAHREPVGAR